MSTPEFEKFPPDRHPLDQFEKFMIELDDSQSGIPRPHAHRAFFAGWSARFNVAMSRLSGKGSDESQDMAVIRDYLKVVSAASSAIHDKYFGYYMENSRLKKRIEDYQLILRKRGIEPIDVPVWKRVSMQRKELRAMQKHAGVQAATIKGYYQKQLELEARIKELESKCPA